MVYRTGRPVTAPREIAFSKVKNTWQKIEFNTVEWPDGAGFAYEYQESSLINEAIYV
jgi:hypothetical protein